MIDTGEPLIKKKSIWDDPVVREVRRAREELWREAGGTIEGLLRLLDEREPRTRRGRGRKTPGSKTGGRQSPK
jgi:hypothetical protein